MIKRFTSRLKNKEEQNTASENSARDKNVNNNNNNNTGKGKRPRKRFISESEASTLGHASKNTLHLPDDTLERLSVSSENMSVASEPIIEIVSVHSALSDGNSLGSSTPPISTSDFLTAFDSPVSSSPRPGEDSSSSFSLSFPFGRRSRTDRLSLFRRDANNLLNDIGNISDGEPVPENKDHPV